jgi:DMSO/TMAO reductase YedYZ molybdopterin-dependent catalytic subunit
LRSRTKIILSIGLVGIISVGIIGALIYLDTNTAINPQYPDFITSNEDYFVTRIGDVPNIDESTYQLSVSGLIDNPGAFSLDELRSLDMVDLPLTTECIGNKDKGPLVPTAIWQGFVLYDFLVSLGLSENATGVQYRAADGYYASHTMDQVKDNGILAALYMNGEVIPPNQGFPLRILNPGYYGAKQPAWVTEIEVINRSLSDYWDDRGWDSSPPMEVDSLIFFPQDQVNLNVNDTLEIGGAAFGGTRVTHVEYTHDSGATWDTADIVQSMDADNVWIFWGAQITFPDPGTFTLAIRATDINNNTQTEDDTDYTDGTSVWPKLTITVT